MKACRLILEHGKSASMTHETNAYTMFRIMPKEAYCDIKGFIQKVSQPDLYSL